MKTFLIALASIFAFMLAAFEYRRWRLHNAVTNAAEQAVAPPDPTQTAPQVDPNFGGQIPPSPSTPVQPPPPPTGGSLNTSSGPAITLSPTAPATVAQMPPSPLTALLQQIYSSTGPSTGSAGTTAPAPSPAPTAPPAPAAPTPSLYSGLVEPWTRLSCSSNYWNPPRSTVNGQPSCSPGFLNPPRTVCSTTGQGCKPRSL